MEYRNLSELIENEKRSRVYFNSLPRSVQTELSVAGDTIHDMSQLHIMARDAGEKFRREIFSRKDYD